MAGEGKFIDHLLKGEIDVRNKIAGKYFETKEQGKYMHLFFDSQPIYMLKGAAYSAPTGADGDENIMSFPEGTLEYHVIGTNTILGPTFGATGLQAVLDAANDEGMETCGGILASNKLVFTVGTSPAFYARMRFEITTVAGTDDCVFGFRKAEAYRAAVDDYDEMAAMNVNAGNILFQNILNGGTTVVTDTIDNWADAATHELAVYVSAAGVVTYKIDGRAPTTTVTYTFDDAEVVTPFFYCIQNSTTTAITMIEFECGLQ